MAGAHLRRVLSGGLLPRVFAAAAMSLTVAACASPQASSASVTSPAASDICADGNVDTSGLDIPAEVTIEAAGPDSLMTDTPVISNTRADAAALVDLRYEDVDQPGRLVQTTTNRPCGRTMLLPGATFREFFWSADDGRRLRVLVDAVTWIPSRFSVPTAGLSFDYADKACEYDDHHRMTSCELINVDPFDIAVHPGIYVLSAGESGYFVTAIRWGAPATIIPARSRAPIKIDPEAVDQVRDLSAGRGYAYGPDWDIALEQPDFPVPEGP